MFSTELKVSLFLDQKIRDFVTGVSDDSGSMHCLQPFILSCLLTAITRSSSLRNPVTMQVKPK